MNLSVGDKIKDNDPRMGTRILEIKRIDDTHVFASRVQHFLHGSTSEDREFRIKITSIHTDGKERRSGFSRV
jgi:hypothetical protein